MRLMAEPMFRMEVKKDVAYKDIKPTIFKMLEEKFKEAGIAIENDMELTLTPPCGCPEMKMKFTEAPLEDLMCPCGKTKLFEIVRT